VGRNEGGRKRSSKEGRGEIQDQEASAKETEGKKTIVGGEEDVSTSIKRVRERW